MKTGIGDKENPMIEKKLNTKIHFFAILFGGVLLMIARVLFMLYNGEVSDESGEPLPRVISGLISFMLVCVGITYLITFIALVKQITVYKNTAFRIDENGIHNTAVFTWLFAFVIASNVEFIPWSSVYLADRETGYIRVRKNGIRASLFGKTILWILGYNFCYGFTKKKLSDAEYDLIFSYCDKYVKK
jgi:hypothetical protein